MTWLAIGDGRRVLRSPAPEAHFSLMPRGTLVAELPFIAEEGRRVRLFDLTRDLPWQNRMQMWLDTAGSVVFEHRQGDSVARAKLTFPAPSPETPLRISVCWHGPERLGLVAVENLTTYASHTTVFQDARPISFGDAAALIGPHAQRHPQICAVAVSDRAEPTGLRGGFAAGTMIDGPHGPRPVETLAPGDPVQTSAHGVQPIRQVVAYDVPSIGRFTPLRLAAPFFGLTEDLVVAHDHRLMVSGPEAEYLFGAEDVLIEARHLNRLAATVERARSPSIRYYHVLLDAHVCLSVSGGWAESLYVGDPTRAPVARATSLVSRLENARSIRHGQIAGPELCGYEAAVLVSALCA